VYEIVLSIYSKQCPWEQRNPCRCYYADSHVIREGFTFIPAYWWQQTEVSFRWGHWLAMFCRCLGHKKKQQPPHCCHHHSLQRSKPQRLSTHKFRPGLVPSSAKRRDVAIPTGRWGSVFPRVLAADRSLRVRGWVRPLSSLGNNESWSCPRLCLFNLFNAARSFGRRAERAESVRFLQLRAPAVSS